MPVGVWQIREGIRRAFEGEGEQIENFEEALSFACINLSLSKNEWKRKSEMYRSRREQLRITDFFRNNNDIRMARDTS